MISKFKIDCIVRVEKEPAGYKASVYGNAFNTLALNHEQQYLINITDKNHHD